MAADKTVPNSSLQDTLKMAAAGLSLVVGVALFYMLDENILFYRVLSVLSMAVVAAILYFMTARGKVTAEFLRGSRIELQKMVWPTKSETLHSVLIVFAAIFIIAIFLWMLDLLLAWLMQMVIR